MSFFHKGLKKALALVLPIALLASAWSGTIWADKATQATEAAITAQGNAFNDIEEHWARSSIEVLNTSFAAELIR